MFDIPAFQVAPNLVLLNFRHLRGVEAICARVPSEAGVYAFFKTFQPPDPISSSAKQFASYLISVATAPHCLPREGRIKPLYSVRLSSKKTISTGKQQQLAQMCESKDFRIATAAALKHAFFFEQPLYVGKSGCIRDRIRQHLSPSSRLRERFKKVGIDIFDLRLMCLRLSGLTPADESAANGEDATADNTAGEGPLEEIFSKLFHPLFVERYG